MILFSKEGVGYQVNDPSKIKELLKKGYSKKASSSSVQAKVLLDANLNSPQALNMNSAKLNDLKKIDGIGVALGKQIIEAQPNLTLESLKTLLPDINWDQPTIDSQPITLEF